MATNQKGMPSQEPSPPNPVSQNTSPGTQARNDQGASKPLLEPPAINLPKGGGAIQGRGSFWGIIKKKIVLLIITLLCLSAGCSNNALAPDKYVEWVRSENNGLTVKKQFQSLEFSLTYQPIPALVLRELGNVSNITKESFTSIQNEYIGMEYYRFRITAPSDVLQYGIHEQQEYYKRVEYYSFQMQHDLRLQTGTDTLKCTLFHFERNYGSAPYLDFMLGFDAKDNNNLDRTLIYNDQIFTNNLIQLTIPAETIQHLPILSL